MKKVFGSHSEVAHVWAQQKQSEGRASRMFFEGPSIYSYGHHFEIARFVSPEIVLFNSDRYSPSTGKHQSRAYRAVSHKTVFTVPSMTDHNENGRYLVENVIDAIKNLQRARTGFDYKPGYIDGQIKTANSYLTFFRRKMSAEVLKAIRNLEKYRLKNLSPEFVAAKLKREKELEAIANERYKVRREAERIAYEERRRLKAIEDAEKIAQWKDGADVYPSYDWPMLLRVKGDTIETSHGANIPLIAARKLWRRFLKNTVAPDLTGLNLGNYTVNGVEVTNNTTAAETEGILTVGCHRIPFAELYRMSDVLGWRNGVPYDATEVLL